MNQSRLTAKLWSAVTCHRFARFADWSAKQRRVQRREEYESIPYFERDESPAKSADKSAPTKE